MQRICVQSATRNRITKNDPILYVNPGQETAWTPKFDDCSVGQAHLIFRLTPTTLVPDPPLMELVLSVTRNRCSGLPETTRRETKIDFEHIGFMQTRSHPSSPSNPNWSPKGLCSDHGSPPQQEPSIHLSPQTGHSQQSAPPNCPAHSRASLPNDLPNFRPGPLPQEHHNEACNNYFRDLLDLGANLNNLGINPGQLPGKDQGNDRLFDEDGGGDDEDEDPLQPLQDGALYNNLNLKPEPEPDSDPDDNEPDINNTGFPALDKPRAIQNVYINAYVQKTLHNTTHRSLKHFISSFEESFVENANIDALDLARMARTIGTVEKRLGLSTKDLITTFTLCPKCSTRYSPTYIAASVGMSRGKRPALNWCRIPALPARHPYASDNPGCTKAGCEGLLYTDNILATGGNKWTSSRTFPYISPINWIQRMLACNGIARLVQAWQTPDDQELRPPIGADEWNQDNNCNEPLGDIMDGWGCRSCLAGVQRVVDPVAGTVVDQSVLDPPVQFASHTFGLSLSMNINWFQSNKEGNYSIGACFLVINNLPPHLCFLCKNMCLALVMPSPNEPNNYALDQLMEPLQGVRMPMWNCENQIFEQLNVHGDLHNQITDLMARIKMIGGAGIGSELNFCLYCRTHLSALSAPTGFLRVHFVHRVPEEELDNCFFYRSLDTAEEREAFFQFTGTRFTQLDRLGGWDAARRWPPDAMHLIFLGAVSYIVKQVIFAPGMLNKRPGAIESPVDIYNACLAWFWFPHNFGRLPPKIGQSSARVKAKQWKVLIQILPILMFEAWCKGNTIPPDHIPQGNASTTGAKHQARRAKHLQRRCLQHHTNLGHPEQAHKVADCLPSRNPRRHFRQIMRAAVLFVRVFVYNLSPNQATFLHGLAEALCVEFVRMNIHLPPNFHQLIHLEQFILENGLLYNTHAWPFERVNHDITRINTNGHGNGVLEGTMMKGWWTNSQVQGIIQRLQAIPDRTPANNSAIQNLIGGLKGRIESKRQRGDLMEFLVLEFCWRLWPAHCFYGSGLAIPGGFFVPPEGAVRKHAYVEYDGLRYGSYWHSGGRCACYGFINNQQPVRIEQVLLIEIPQNPQLQTIYIEPDFPWSAWQGHLGATNWKYNTLGPTISVPAAHFSGVFALIDHRMSYGHYWVTLSLKNIQEDFEEEQEDVDNDDAWN
ncbi:hypothetical protein BDV93DRAFT_515687 [Ceratobasidium sp. AG-I]|nr:hypothetical protein BDV93DRAFT_515687 [Ceratobasidium sp. AG-I]